MRHTIVVDLGYGDAGKGTVVDLLCSVAPVPAVVRFNGGAQAAHNVLTPDGRQHTFAQFGSGTLAGVPTLLSRYAIVDPLALAGEAEHLAALGVIDPYQMMSVDAEALLTTPWHAAANRRREQARGTARHGSCGMGVGETAAYALAHPDAPRAGDVRDRSRLRRRLAAVRDRLTADLDLPEVAPLDAVVDAFLAFGQTVSIVDGRAVLRRLLDRGPCVFEGAQGVLLDEWYGWHPYTTWSTTTFANARALLAEAGHTAYRLGVLRTYTTRHGAGPLVTEDPAVTAALPERHNGTGRWQGAFRAGHFDAVAHRYAVEVCGGVDGLAVTHLDAPGRYPDLRLCRGYRLGARKLTRLVPGVQGDLAYTERLGLRLDGATPVPGPVPDDWSTAIGETLGAPVVIESYGPNRTDKFFTTTASRTLQPVG